MKPHLKSCFISVEEASHLIGTGAALSIAGAEKCLDQLPRGKWIGGTAYYFMTSRGGLRSDEMVWVTPLHQDIEIRLECYKSGENSRLVSDAPFNGYTLLIIPYGSTALRDYAQKGRFVSGIFLHPIIGWVAGVDLNARETTKPYCYFGPTGQKFEDGMVAAHVSLPEARLATVETINIFERDTSHVLRFPKVSFEVKECTLDGRAALLAEFLIARENRDCRRPLIGDFAGASVNTSIKSIDDQTNIVHLYSPVFPDVEYYLSKPVHDHAPLVAREIGIRSYKQPEFSCNCILNYQYGRLEGKSTGGIVGPITFGEIAYLLHNQTLALLVIH